MTTNTKPARGFASMTTERVREIASMGGKRAHQIGVAHEFTSAEASKVGRLGGLSRAANVRRMKKERA